MRSSSSRRMYAGRFVVFVNFDVIVKTSTYLDPMWIMKMVKVTKPVLPTALRTYTNIVIDIFLTNEEKHDATVS